MISRPFATMCLLLLACVGAPRAFAANECTVVGPASGVNFGTYDTASGTAVTAIGTSITVACTGNRTVTFELGSGGGSITSRYMTTGLPGSDLLYYNLYLEPANVTIFGTTGVGGTAATCTTGVNTTACMGDNPTGSDKLAQRRIYGLIPAGQNVGAGTYTDTITYTVTF